MSAQNIKSNIKAMGDRSLEAFFRQDVKYFVVKDDGYGERMAWHDQYPYPHLIVVYDLKRYRRFSVRKHKICFAFDSTFYKAFLVGDEDDIQHIIEGLIMYAAVAKGVSKKKYELEVFAAWQFVVKRINQEIREKLGLILR